MSTIFIYITYIWAMTMKFFHIMCGVCVILIEYLYGKWQFIQQKKWRRGLNNYTGRLIITIAITEIYCKVQYLKFEQYLKELKSMNEHVRKMWKSTSIQSICGYGFNLFRVNFASSFSFITTFELHIFFASRSFSPHRSTLLFLICCWKTLNISNDKAVSRL